MKWAVIATSRGKTQNIILPWLQKVRFPCGVHIGHRRGWANGRGGRWDANINDGPCIQHDGGVGGLDVDFCGCGCGLNGVGMAGGGHDDTTVADDDCGGEIHDCTDMMVNIVQGIKAKWRQSMCSWRDHTLMQTHRK